jgi:hypothetical protein
VVFYNEIDADDSHILSHSDDGVIVGSFPLRATENAKFVIRSN